MFIVTATHINYYHICKRKLWLFANGIQMEYTSVKVAEGKLIGDRSYPQRPEKYTELEINGSKIDFYDAKERTIHEIKKSTSMEVAHEWQVKYYIWLLAANGIENVKGVIEYPRLRQTKAVQLLDGDRITLQSIIQEVREITQNRSCPPTINKPFCKKCSYYELCYIGE